jgi:hypothetical protein
MKRQTKYEKRKGSKAVGAASRISSVVLPPENNNKGSCTLNAPGGGVKAKASKYVPVDGIRKAVAIAKETAKQIDSIVESNASENEEVNDEQEQRLLESRIRAQRRAFLEYELKKLKTQLDELQEPILRETTSLMTNDIDNGAAIHKSGCVRER